MMDRMIDEQIIKALECCATDVRENTCPKCAFYKKHRCSTLMLNAAYDLTIRQKAEIESLKQIIDEKDKEIIKLQKRIIFWREDLNYQPKKVKYEAIKEFVERLKRVISDEQFSRYGIEYEIDRIAKEMTEVQK